MGRDDWSPVGGDPSSLQKSLNSIDFTSDWDTKKALAQAKMGQIE